MRKKKKNLKVLKAVELPLPSLNPPKKTKKGKVPFLQIMCEVKNKTQKGLKHEPTIRERRKVPQEACCLTNQAQMQIRVKHKENHNARKPKHKRGKT